MDDERRDQLDEALDEALASYGKAPENGGLERRVLARITAARTKIHPARTLALAAIALLACLTFWLTQRMAVQTAPPTMAMRASRKMEAPPIRSFRASQPAAVLASADKPRRTRKKTAEPKLPQFPAPSPLSSEEQALLRLAAQEKANPPELIGLGRPPEPIHIAAIEIRPIAPGWDTKEKECCNQ